MSEYFPELCEPSGGNVNVELDLSSYATKVDQKLADLLCYMLTCYINASRKNRLG